MSIRVVSSVDPCFTLAPFPDTAFLLSESFSLLWYWLSSYSSHIIFLHFLHVWQKELLLISQPCRMSLTLSVFGKRNGNRITSTFLTPVSEVIDGFTLNRGLGKVRHWHYTISSYPCFIQRVDVFRDCTHISKEYRSSDTLFIRAWAQTPWQN